MCLNKDLKYFTIKHWNKCEQYIHLKAFNKNSKVIIFQPAYSGSRSQVGLNPILAAQSTRAEPTHIHTHTHSDWDKLDTPINLTCTSFRYQRKSEYLERTYAEMGRVCKFPIDSAPHWNWFFFSSSTSQWHWMIQHYSRTCCNWKLTDS